MTCPPPAPVRAAFGLCGEPVLLPGGQRRTWRIAGAVLKPSGHLGASVWVAGVLETLGDPDGVRVPRPVRARDGSWTVQGWEAWQVVAGEPDTSRPDDALRAGEAFHRALAGIPRPGFLDTRDDPWSYGDRVAWQELPVRGDAVMAELLQPLVAARRRVDLPAQPVHGDLLGNVLYADGLQPAVIDWSVYVRPPSWSLAVAVVDALTWYGAPRTLLERWAGQPEWDQMLLRALIYRIATNQGFRRAGMPVRERPDSYRPVVDLVLARAGRWPGRSMPW